jgi:predicted MPP superfamily phosphohydrolase
MGLDEAITWGLAGSHLGSAIIGHFAIAVFLYNRLHAKAWPRKLVKSLEKGLLLFAAAVLGWLLWQCGTGRGLLWWPWDRLGLEFDLLHNTPPAEWLPLAYIQLCRLAFLAAIPLWLVPKLRERTPAALVENHTECHDLRPKLGPSAIGKWSASVAAAIPGNEILKLHVQRKTIALPRLPRALEGLTIAHLSDLHMTGKLTASFYHEVVELTNDQQPDLIVLTGDIAEKQQCLPWIKPTLGRLRARLGVYYILGNHEQRLGDVRPLRAALQDAGLRNLGSDWTWIDEAGAAVFLAGTERPWFGTEPDVRAGLAARNESPDNALRVLLSHTPDEYAFARNHHFDLMLAGHNHGGQIRLPWLGALITPSRFGCRYAGGLYDEPPTVLHVSRGVAGQHSVRFNCPPEIAILKLSRKK